MSDLIGLHSFNQHSEPICNSIGLIYI